MKYVNSEKGKMTFVFSDKARRPAAVHMTLNGYENYTVTIESVNEIVADLLRHGKKVSLEPIFASEITVEEEVK